MNKLFITILIGCFSGNVFAACPAKLDGNYVGSAQYTEGNGLALADGTWLGSAIASVEYNLFVSKFSGNTATIIKQYKASSNGGVAEELNNETGRFTVSYDKATCSGSLVAPQQTDDPIYFVVGNNGQTIKMISGTSPNDEYRHAIMFEFIKQ